MEPTRWTASLRVSWRPVLTFTRRRFALLDWLDENVELSAFTEDERRIGAEVGRVQRLTVFRSGLTVDLLHPDSDAAALEAMISSALEIMAPTAPTPEWYSGAWSAGVDRAYDELRISLARRVSGLSDPGLVPSDCSALLDVAVLDGGFGQVEFGIVTRDELQERLSDVEMGRLAPAGGEQQRPPLRVDAAALPPVGLFVDVNLELAGQKVATSGNDILSALVVAEESAARIVKNLHDAL